MDKQIIEVKFNDMGRSYYYYDNCGLAPGRTYIIRTDYGDHYDNTFVRIIKKFKKRPVGITIPLALKTIIKAKLVLPTYTKNFLVKDIIFSDDRTIVFWQDDTKTVVKCNEDYDSFDLEKGIALCFMKKACGNTGKFNDIFRKYNKEI